MSNKTNNHLWAFILLAALCGLVAGILGEIVTRVYILNDYSSSFSPEVNLSSLNSNSQGLVIRDPKKVVVNQDVKTTETVANIRPVLVSIYKQNATSTDPLKPDFYNLEEPQFIGLIITSDGWVMSLAPDTKGDFKAKDYVVMGSNRQVYKIDKVADSKDFPGNPLVFHLAGASNLPVKKIAPRSELSLGESLLVINALDSVWPTTLTSISRANTVLSSEKMTSELKFDGDYANSLVFDMAGDLVAVISPAKQITPAFSYESAWLSLTKKTAPAYLGVNYLDLSEVKVTGVNLMKGALLYPSATQAAVIKDGPAAQAGLKAGDIITWVNNQEINDTSDLADLLASFNAGDKVTLTYLRGGAEKEADVKLGQIK